MTEEKIKSLCYTKEEVDAMIAEAVEEDRKNQSKKPKKEKVEEPSEEPRENQEETPVTESIQEELELVE